MLSGINADTQRIPDGCPIAWQSGREELDRVLRAGGAVAAIGIATSGAIPLGVVNYRTDGSVSIEDWTLVTGYARLTQFAIYRLSSNAGRLTTSGSGQIVGVASSVKELRMAIDTVDTATAADSAATSTVSAEVAALQALFDAHIAATTAHGTSTAILGSMDGTSVQFGLTTTAQLKVTGGTPGVNKKLLSDADGNATWSASRDYDSGTFNISNGVDTEAVSGLALGYTPTAIIPVIRKPAGGLKLFPNVIDGTITADGFTFDLNGVTDSANYILDFIVIP